LHFLGSGTNYFSIINLKNKIMQAQIITYQLKDISQAEYLKQMVEPDAPIIAKVKGLFQKFGWQTKKKILLAASIYGKTKPQWKTLCIPIW
jgi:hypothetical protein